MLGGSGTSGEGRQMKAGEATERRRWMRGVAAPLRGALLGLVLERPGHGGDLASRLRGRLGREWQVNANDVYRLLQALEAEGLVCCREERLMEGRHQRSRVVYHPTEETAGAVAEWMATLFEREPVRRTIEAKLGVGRKCDLEGLGEALRAYQEECLALAGTVARGSGGIGSWQTLLLDCAADRVHRVLRAELDWAARTIARMGEHGQRAQ